MKTEEKQFETKNVIIYFSTNPDAPVIYSNNYAENGEELLKMARQNGTPDFHLVSISNLSWNQDMSPWPHDAVFPGDDDFTGQADEYMHLMEEMIIPWSETILPPTHGKRILMGYSMAGLFAVYAPFISDRFSSVISVSGSVWYPGFQDFFLKHDFVNKPEAMYFSLGAKETHTRNPMFQETDDVMKSLVAECKQRGVKSIFESNPGNHFTDPELRIVKGINWMLNLSLA